VKELLRGMESIPSIVAILAPCCDILCFTKTTNTASEQKTVIAERAVPRQVQIRVEILSFDVIHIPLSTEYKIGVRLPLAQKPTAAIQIATVQAPYIPNWTIVLDLKETRVQVSN
jgi:hypothetical protein